jgi:DNA-binding transcriptional LysR family regulator
LTLYAIYPPTRHLATKVRLFIDYLVKRFSKAAIAA